jgi:hypothetical protein
MTSPPVARCEACVLDAETLGQGPSQRNESLTTFMGENCPSRV